MVGPTLVSSNSAQELEQVEAARELRWVARTLAANAMRIVRGAGAPTKLTQQISDYLDAAARYRDGHGYWPGPELGALMSFQDHDPDAVGRYDPRAWAIDEIVAGALQIAASRLVDQRSQEAAGESQLLRGVAQLREIHNERLTRFTALQKSDRNVKPVRKRKT